jgi:hypothetical protein
VQEAKISVGKAQILLVGSIYGLCSEADEIERALSSFEPEIIAIGISEEDLQALVDESATDIYDSYFSGLSRFGKVSIPSPDMVMALKYAGEKGIEVEAIDIDDNEFSEMLYNNVSSFELISRSRRIRVRSRSAEEFSKEWDRKRNRGGFERINRMCEERMVENVIKIAKKHDRVFVLLDMPRFDGVLSKLT